MKKRFSCKDEAIFMSLCSHAAYILEDENRDYDERIINIATHIVKYFKKPNTKRYTLKQAGRVAWFLRHNVEPIIVNGSSAVLHMLISMDYLLKVTIHKESKLAFGAHKPMIEKLLHVLEQTEYRDKVFEHYTMLDNIVDS